MADDKPIEVGWLHYRLAVAFCSAFVACVMLLLGPLVLGISSAMPRVLVMYAFVFSKWGVATVLGVFALGLAVGGERMANVFAIIWGTHPFWSELERSLYELGDWLDEHKAVGSLLAVALGLLVVGIFWYGFG